MLLKNLNSSLVKIPAPWNISRWWNFGSLLGVCLGLQIITGLLVALHYSRYIDYAFSRVVHICRDVNIGWFLRTLHANGASFFFICLYLHIRRGFYYSSYNLLETCLSGVTIFFFSHSHSIFRICSSLRTNIILGGYSYYKFTFYSSIYWPCRCTMLMRRICSRCSYFNPIFCLSFSCTLFNFRYSIYTYSVLTPNRF